MVKFGLIGYPLKHSFSGRFFSEKFKKEHIDAVYLNFEIPEITQFPQILKSNPELKGLNVTIPYKEQVITYLDDISDDAKKIGAVNVIKIERTEQNVKLVGYNSDVIGFQNSISPLINTSIHHKALILGTGGAAKASNKGLRNLGLETKYVSRTPKEGMFTYQDFDEKLMREYTVIVNCTPLGTFPDIDEAPEIPYQYLTAKHLLYDLVYNPAETKYLKLGKEKGAAVKNGEEMLRLQALAAWEIWNRK